MATYNSNEESNYRLYLNANNLYGYAMSHYLLYGDFEWRDEYNDSCEFTVDVWKNKILEIINHSDTGYKFEVELEYSKELLDCHKDLSLSLECKLKLPTTLENKQYYIIHYRNLKQSLGMGLKLTEIYNILKTTQTSWLDKL